MWVLTVYAKPLACFSRSRPRRDRGFVGQCMGRGGYNTRVLSVKLAAYVPLVDSR